MCVIVFVFVLVIYLAWSTYKPNRFKTVYTDSERNGSSDLSSKFYNLCKYQKPIKHKYMLVVTDEL